MTEEKVLNGLDKIKLQRIERLKDNVIKVINESIDDNKTMISIFIGHTNKNYLVKSTANEWETKPECQIYFDSNKDIKNALTELDIPFEDFGHGLITIYL